MSAVPLCWVHHKPMFTRQLSILEKDLTLSGTAILGYISKPALNSVVWLWIMMEFAQFEAKIYQLICWLNTLTVI